MIGYEKRMLRKEDFNNDKIDAGEIGAGHTVTALYEVVPVGASPDPAASVPPVDPLKYQASTDDGDSFERSKSSPEMMTVKLRYKKPDGDKSELIERALVDNGAKFANASTDLKFAAAVAEFGMMLRDSRIQRQRNDGRGAGVGAGRKRRRCERLSRRIHRARAQDAIADQGLEIFRRLNCRGRFHAHGEKCAQKQNGRAPELGCR